MAQYEYKGWKLFSREVSLRYASKPVRIYFFSKKEPKSGEPVSEEDFRELNAIIKENPRTKLPFVKRKDKLDNI
jgi:hypothetical protein